MHLSMLLWPATSASLSQRDSKGSYAPLSLSLPCYSRLRRVVCASGSLSLSLSCSVQRCADGGTRTLLCDRVGLTGAGMGVGWRQCEKDMSSIRSGRATHQGSAPSVHTLKLVWMSDEGRCNCRCVPGRYGRPATQVPRMHMHQRHRHRHTGRHRHRHGHRHTGRRRHRVRGHCCFGCRPPGLFKLVWERVRLDRGGALSLSYVL